MTIWCTLVHPGLQFWLIVDSNNSCYFILGHYTFSAQYRLNIWVQNEEFFTSTSYNLVFKIPSTFGPALFIGFSISMLFLILFNMLVGWVIHVHSIKFPFHLVLGEPSPKLALCSNLFLWFLDTTGFNIFNYLKVIIVGVLSFNFG